jgi:hypothetical protein
MGSAVLRHLKLGALKGIYLHTLEIWGSECDLDLPADMGLAIPLLEAITLCCPP